MCDYDSTLFAGTYLLLLYASCVQLLNIKFYNYYKGSMNPNSTNKWLSKFIMTYSLCSGVCIGMKLPRDYMLDHD